MKFTPRTAKVCNARVTHTVKLKSTACVRNTPKRLASLVHVDSGSFGTLDVMSLLDHNRLPELKVEFNKFNRGLSMNEFVGVV